MAKSPGADRLEQIVFDFIAKSEEAIVDAGRKWAKALGEFVPEETPAVQELVKGVFDFTEEVLAAQRDFAHKILRETRTTVGEMAPTSPKPGPLSHSGTPRASRPAGTRPTPRARNGAI